MRSLFEVEDGKTGRGAAARSAFSLFPPCSSPSSFFLDFISAKSDTTLDTDDWNFEFEEEERGGIDALLLLLSVDESFSSLNDNDNLFLLPSDVSVFEDNDDLRLLFEPLLLFLLISARDGIFVRDPDLELLLDDDDDEGSDVSVSIPRASEVARVPKISFKF